MDITQSYRSDDPVQNLKVRVTLRCIAGAFPGRNTQEAKDADKAGHDADAESTSPEPEPEPEADNSSPEPEPEADGSSPEPESGSGETSGNGGGGGGGGGGLPVYTRTLSWQEKVFSSRELLFYRGKERKDAARNGALSHWQKVQNIDAADSLAADDSEERATGVISTYVDADSHWTLEQLGREDPDESPESMLAYSSGSSDLTSVARKMRQLNSSKKAVFNRKMSHAEKELYQDSAFSRMQVVFSGQDGDEEMLLCVIKVYQGKGEATVLEMRPGFNTPEEPTHRINQNGCTYDLCVELVSEQTGTADPDEDRSQMQRQKERNERIQLLKNRSHPGVFEPMVPPSGRAWDVRMQLVSAHGFDYDNTYVEYCWQLPSRWQLNKEMLGGDYGGDGTKALLSGCTQMADRRYDRFDFLGLKPFCHFGLPNEFSLREAGRSFTKPTDRQWPSDQPCLFLKVSTVDWWSRYKLLGYGYVPLPTEPGTFDMEVHTWRPVQSRVEDMRSFFVGGSAEMDPLWTSSSDATPWAPNIAMPSVGADFNGSYLNKFGFNTSTAGTIKLQLNSIVRTKPPAQAARRAGLNNLLKKGRKGAGRSKDRAKKNIMAGGR